MKLPRIERALTDWIARGARHIGQVAILEKNGGGFSLCHREDESRIEQLQQFHSPNDAVALAKFDDEGNYRPLKTSPNLRHGWRLDLAGLSSLKLALDFFYPGRLAALVAWETNRQLKPVALRTTLNRQSGMYRIAAKISDADSDALVGRFCRSAGGEPGCLRTILWRRDETGAPASTQLPGEKFDPQFDQSGRGEGAMPLLCQEACNLLVAEARRVVKGDADEGDP